MRYKITFNRSVSLYTDDPVKAEILMESYNRSVNPPTLTIEDDEPETEEDKG